MTIKNQSTYQDLSSTNILDEETLINCLDILSRPKILKDIRIPIKNGELKELVYTSLEKIPKVPLQSSTVHFSGINIVEDPNMLDNILMFRYTNPTLNQIFIYKEGKLYEMDFNKLQRKVWLVDSINFEDKSENI